MSAAPPVSAPPVSAPPVVVALPAPEPPDRRPTTRPQRVAILLALLAVGLLGLWLFDAILLPFVVAAGIAYFLDPPTSRLAALGIPRTACALLMICALLALALLFVLLLYPLLMAQIGLLIGRVPSYAYEIQAWAGTVLARLQDRLGPEFVDSHLRDLVSNQAGIMLGFLASALARIVGSGFALFNVLSLLVVAPVVAFYLLRDWPRMVARLDGWLPRRYAGVLRTQGREVDRILAAWLRGQLLCCLILGGFYATALSFVGLDLGLTVGLASGLLSFIPYVGTITGAVSSVGLALAQFPDWRGVALVAGVFLLGQVLENYIIYPRFLGDRVELHAVWVIFALFAGGAVFGFLGVLLAVPAAAAIGVVVRFWLGRYMRSSLYLDTP